MRFFDDFGNFATRLSALAQKYARLIGLTTFGKFFNLNYSILNEYWQ